MVVGVVLVVELVVEVVDVVGVVDVLHRENKRCAVQKWKKLTLMWSM